MGVYLAVIKQGCVGNRLLLYCNILIIGFLILRVMQPPVKSDFIDLFTHVKSYLLTHNM